MRVTTKAYVKKTDLLILNLYLIAYLLKLKHK